MPLPYEYRHPGEEFDAFLREVMEACNFATRNPAYTTTEAVLRTFRRRLSVRDGLRFADVLPPVLRALFVKEWAIDEKPLPFASREELTAEVKALRRDHNFSPDTAIADVARSLRKHVDEMKLDAVLATLPQGAVEFWKAD
ncbi:MAG: DUF2267 domain-containing protein [Alphaproteobacteria bacterium]|nr:DUF2267 domain-containing protein [Alphaproteobacteria bacterium]